jgi:plasmid stabilization system protein ParE
VRRARFLASVRADFLGILTYIAESTGSVAVGETFVTKLRAKCHALAALQATIGRPRPELRPSPVMTGLVLLEAGDDGGRLGIDRGPRWPLGCGRVRRSSAAPRRLRLVRDFIEPGNRHRIAVGEFHHEAQAATHRLDVGS